MSNLFDVNIEIRDPPEPPDLHAEGRCGVSEYRDSLTQWGDLITYCGEDGNNNPVAFTAAIKNTNALSHNG